MIFLIDGIYLHHFGILNVLNFLIPLLSANLESKEILIEAPTKGLPECLILQILFYPLDLPV